MNLYTVAPEAKASFLALVGNINDAQRAPWDSIRQLPWLTRAQYAVILRANPDALDDIRPDTNQLADALAANDEEKISFVTSYMPLMELQAELRRLLFDELQYQQQESRHRDAARQHDAESRIDAARMDGAL